MRKKCGSLYCRGPLCRYTLQELCLENPYGITDFAVTEPFQLLTEAGVKQLLSEVLSKEVQRQCAFKEARLPWYKCASASLP